MAKYKKKPVIIDAVQLTNTNYKEVKDFAGDAVSHLVTKLNYGPSYCSVHTLEGILKAMAGDFIVKGGNGEFRPVREDVFPTLYDRID